MIRTLAAAAALLFCPAAALAAPATLPGLSFEVPAGWTQKTVADGIVLQRNFLHDGQKSGALVAVSIRPLAGTFTAAFAAAANGFEALRGEKPLIAEEGETTLGHTMAWERRCCGDGKATMSLTTVAINPPGRILVTTLVEIELADDDEDSVEADFDALVASLDVAGVGRRPPVPRPLGYGEKLSGVYSGTELQLRPNVFGGLDTVADTDVFAFEPSGRFADTPPAVDVAQTCAAEPEGCGVYTVIGNRIALKTVSGNYGLVSTETLDFAHDGDGLKLGDRSYMPIPPEQNLTLDGSWTYTFAQSGMTAMSSTGVSSSRTYAFTPDGRYTRTGSHGFSSSNGVGDGTVGVAGSGRRPATGGRYAIAGYTLTLTDASGGTEQLSFYRPDKGDSDLLMIDGLAFLRDGRD